MVTQQLIVISMLHGEPEGMSVCARELYYALSHFGVPARVQAQASRSRHAAWRSSQKRTAAVLDDLDVIGAFLWPFRPSQLAGIELWVQASQYHDSLSVSPVKQLTCRTCAPAMSRVSFVATSCMVLQLSWDACWTLCNLPPRTVRHV